jgi:hypothetical protein
MVYLELQKLNPKYKEMEIRCTIYVYCWTMYNLFVQNVETDTMADLC